MSSNSLPPSALLDRLKNFLPQIAKANEELDEKIKKEGNQSVVIDTNMIASNPEEGDESNLKDEEDENADDSKPVVQIEFALGDFDDSAIANVEETILTEKNKLQNGHDDEEVDDDN